MPKRRLMCKKSDWSKALIGDIVYFDGNRLKFMNPTEWTNNLGSYVGTIYNNEANKVQVIAGIQAYYTYDSGRTYCLDYSVLGKTTGWRMPEQTELSEMYVHKTLLNTSFSYVECPTFIESQAYWSNTGYTTSNPYYVWFDNGYVGNGRSKSESLVVRPVTDIEY